MLTIPLLTRAYSVAVYAKKSIEGVIWKVSFAEFGLTTTPGNTADPPRYALFCLDLVARAIGPGLHHSPGSLDQGFSAPLRFITGIRKPVYVRLVWIVS